MIMYGARGAGTLWEAEPWRPPKVLAELARRHPGRAAGGPGGPCVVDRVAGRLGVTTPAVNQHLRAMRDVGLLTSARHGRSVLYLRSELRRRPRR